MIVSREADMSKMRIAAMEALVHMRDILTNIHNITTFSSSCE